MEAVKWAVHSLKFAPQLEQLADQICMKILLQSPKGFDGVHLRIEGDAMHAGFVASLAGNNSMKVMLTCRDSIMALERKHIMKTAIVHLRHLSGQLDSHKLRLICRRL